MANVSECKVSGGESKVSRRVGLPRSSCTPRSKLEIASLYFLVVFSRLLFYVATVEPPVSYFEAILVIRLFGAVSFLYLSYNVHNLQSRTINCSSDMQSASTQTQKQSLHAIERFSSAECRSLCQSPINTALNTFVFRNSRIALVRDRYLNGC